MSVRERTREIAVMKAVGFSGRRVLGLLIFEGVGITLTGGLIGSLGARVLYSLVIVDEISAFTLNFIQRFEITWGIIFLGILISILVGILSTAIPAYRSVRLTVADGLRHLG